MEQGCQNNGVIHTPKRDTTIKVDNNGNESKGIQHLGVLEGSKGQPVAELIRKLPHPPPGAWEVPGA